MTTIYLAGPIDGLTFEEANSWREEAAKHLRGLDANVVIINPLDKMPGLRTLGRAVGGSEGNDPRWIFESDIERGVVPADAVLAGFPRGYVPSPGKAFTGTLFELGSAYMLGTPFVLWIPGVAPEHPFLSTPAAAICSTLGSACVTALAAGRAAPTSRLQVLGQTYRVQRRILVSSKHPRIIGIMGRGGSGKSAVAAILARSGFVQYGLADNLKYLAGLLFGLSREQMFGGLKETVDGRYSLTPRYILQRFGTEVARTVYPDIWVEALRRTMSPEESYVIDDVRFPNEAKAIRSWGGELWLVRGRSPITSSEHASEQALEEVVAPDVVIENTVATLAELEEVVLGQLRG